MNNFKKIGLTALAGSLVAAAAIAGEISSIRWCKHEHYHTKDESVNYW